MADGADRNDADLVADVRAGNVASFALLFNRWFGPVLGAAHDLLGERAEAARVATDTFQSVWLHLDELADPDGFGAWVLLTSRTFARQRQAERDPSAPVPSGPLFENEDELRQAVARVLVRRQVPALGQPIAPSPVLAPSGPEVQAPPPSLVGGGADPVTAAADAATVRQHRYHWAPAEPTPGLAERVRTVRLSPGTLVALAIMLLGSVIWLMSRDDSSEIDGGRPAPLFSPAAPTTIDGAAARSDNGAAAPGGVGIAPGSLPPDPATPAPTDAPPPASNRKVKVAAVLPRSVATTPTRRSTTAAPGPAATVTPVTTASGAPRTDNPPSTTPTVAPSSSATTTATTARTTTTAEPTTATTARTTTTAEPTTATTARTTTTTAEPTTATTARTTTTTRVTTITTRVTTPTTAATTTSRPTTTSTLAPATRVTASTAPATSLQISPLGN